MKRISKNVNDLQKIVEGLTRLTSVPRDKSVICWQRERVFGLSSYRAEHKKKIYLFDGRHFYVYPAGYELLPGVSIGDRRGPAYLLHVKVSAASKSFGDLWMNINGQYEKELQEEKNERFTLVLDGKLRSKKEQKQREKTAQEILNDFK